MISLAANNLATVSLSLFFNSESCYHYFGGIIPFYAKYIATVQPSLSLIVGS